MCIVPISPGLAAIVHYNGYTALWHYGATFKLNAMNQNKIAFLLDLWDNNSKLAVKIKLNNVFCISTYLWTKL